MIGENTGGDFSSSIRVGWIKNECPYAACVRREQMKLNEAIAPAGAELVKVKKIADQASKVIISGIDKITSKTNMADEFQYYSMVKNYVRQKV